MAINITGLSLDYLIHPGKTLKEYLEDREMSQEELAIRTGYSAKHISEVVRCMKDISSKFASSLEVALGVPAHFWINLQANYDNKVYQIESVSNINKEEYKVLDDLTDIIKFCEKQGIINPESKKELTLLNVRKFLCINNLMDITKLPICQTAFRGSSKYKVNYNVLYAWKRICEFYTENIHIEHIFDSEKLKSMCDDIKKTMFLDANEMVAELKKLFAECGIIFEVVRNFAGAPVQGFIQKKNDKVILCMTIRQSFTDIFWFTLFHEIAHLINGDYTDTYIDFQTDNKFDYTLVEKNADEFARNTLIDPNDYKLFIDDGSINPISVMAFAKTQKVLPGIVVGRLQNDTGNYKLMSKLRSRYVWENDN